MVQFLVCNERSGGISLKFTKFPRNLAQKFTPSLALQQTPCHSSPQESQLLHSPSTLLLLKQNNCYTQGC